MKIISYEEFQVNGQTSDIEKYKEIDEIVLNIIKNVRLKGDRALFQYTRKFDRVTLESLLVEDEEFEEAEQLVSAEFKKSVEVAANNIREFHQHQVEKSWFFHKENGITLGQKVTPMDRVGVYIPGGKAAYPSTVLMNVIPAKLAGVPEIFIATPPQENGKINAHVLYTAKFLGVERIYKMGGAQAVAAFAYGTETIPKVSKIVGPGNDFVARAKKWVFGDVAIDMIAGPSEICVVADESAPAKYVAADLLSQAEHDEAATSICITTSEELAEKISKEVEQQLSELPREKIARTSIENNGKIVVTENLEQAFKLVNEIAPEHLQLMFENASEYLSEIKHAGAIFLGSYSPEPLGDYLAGPNHTLPTSGTAKFASPLGVYDFVKKSSIIQYSEEALKKEAPYIETLANMEGLEAHAKSISIRRKER